MSYDYQQAIKEKGVTMSISRKGTPTDNPLIETFHSSLIFYLHRIHSTSNSCVIRIQTKLNNHPPLNYR